MRTISFLGTGSGMPVQSSTSCIFLEDGKTNLLIDVGGGHDVLGQFYALNIKPSIVDNIFISHLDSDHILGIVPLVRSFWGDGKSKKRTIYCNIETRQAVESLFSHVAKHRFDALKENLHFVDVQDHSKYEIGDWKVIFFDIGSSKTPQSGLFVQFPDKKTLAFLGDEPLHNSYASLVQNPTVLIHEAFCVDDDKGEFRPHEKNHGTAREAAENAARLHAETLILFHMEDKTLESRKKRYGAEVKKYFFGEVVVPVDCEQYQF